MWASVGDRDGQVCVVTFTGTDRGDQRPGSRVIFPVDTADATKIAAAAPTTHPTGPTP